ncbi:MAG TPA: hypothetical protein PLL14_09950, partial [Accumulibacter sp.]|nr:hypothetical protein [Accumulibacter sp.]
GRGSRFSVRLPGIIAGAGAPTASVPSPASTAATVAGRGTLILVVEDDGRLVPIVTRLIETLGYAVLCPFGNAA